MKANIVKRVCVFGLLGCLAGLHVRAQESPDAPRSAASQISLLAVGALPEITLTDTEKGSFYNEPPESEIPPGLLFVKEKSEFKTFMLELNTPMEPILHPGGTMLRLFQNKSDAEDPQKEAFVQIPLPKEKVDLTVFLLRNPATRNWRVKPLAVPFKNDLVSFPLNSTRIINFSSVPIRVQTGKTVFDLGVRESRILPYPTMSKGILEYKIGARIKERALLIADAAKSYYPGTRMNLIAYDADGTQRKHPIDHVAFVERTREKLAAEK